MPDPLTWPVSVCAYRVNWHLSHNNTAHRSPFTRKRRVVVGQGVRWEATLSIRVARRKSQTLDAMLDELQGIAGSVRLWDMSRPRPLGPALDRSSLEITTFTDGTGFTDGGSPETITYFSGGDAGYRVWGGWSIGTSQVLVDGFPANTTQLYKGDYVGLNNRLYRLIRDATADGLGRAYLYLNRELVAAVAHLSVPVLTKPTTPMALVGDDDVARPVDYNGVYEYTLPFEEVP